VPVPVILRAKVAAVTAPVIASVGEAGVATHNSIRLQWTVWSP
jgi:hypothetical protein